MKENINYLIKRGSLMFFRTNLSETGLKSLSIIPPWVIKVYRFAVVLGIAALMSLITLNLLLRVGLVVGGSLTAVILYMLFGMDSNKHRANLAQTAGSGASFGVCGMVVIFALMIIDHPDSGDTPFRLGAWQVMVLMPVVFVQGILYALPARRLLVHKLGLPWPTATACVKILNNLENIVNFGDWRVLVKNWLHLLVSVGWALFGNFRGISPYFDPLYMGLGFLTRYQMGLSLLLGTAFFAYFDLPFMGEEPWKRWFAIALMTTASLSALVTRLWIELKEIKLDRQVEEEKFAFWGKELFGVQSKVAAYGLYGGVFVANAALLVFLLHAFVEVPILPASLMLLGAWPVVLLVGFCVGSIDVNPTVSMIKALMVLTALFGFTGGAWELMGLMVIGASATIAGDWLLDTRTGDQIGTPFRLRLGAELLGCLVGVGVATPMLYELVRRYGIGDEGSKLMSAPGARALAELAEAAAGGMDFSRSMWLVIMVGAYIGVKWGKMEAKRRNSSFFVPSAIGFGTAWFLFGGNPAGLAIGVAMLLGGLLRLMTERKLKSWDDKYAEMVGGGFIIGDAIFTVLVFWLLA
ncbi:hypothetical protein HN748_02425 [Candidatus Peregrinibacteria bacterium]|nr:hypothetical protein [Candidatus Peregrinibacteria bacterium]